MRSLVKGFPEVPGIAPKTEMGFPAGWLGTPWPDEIT